MWKGGGNVSEESGNIDPSVRCSTNMRIKKISRDNSKAIVEPTDMHAISYNIEISLNLPT
jgi:hypothetical protein